MSSQVTFQFDQYNYEPNGDDGTFFGAEVKLEVSNYSDRGKALQLLKDLVEEAERKLGQAE